MGKKKATRFWVALVYAAFYLLLLNVTFPCQPNESSSLQNNNGKDVNGKINNVIVAVQDRLFSPWLISAIIQQKGYVSMVMSLLDLMIRFSPDLVQAQPAANPVGFESLYYTECTLQCQRIQF